jgi:hypothetical protein
MSTRARIKPVLLLFLSFGLCAAAPPTTAPDASPCYVAAYRALDFTIGTWRVTDPDGNSRGTAEVKYDLGGCTVVENWKAPDGHRGTNVDAYSSDDKNWHRLFADNKGHVHVFAGVIAGTSIHYDGTSKAPDGAEVLNRLNIRMQNSDKMMQLWQQSSDRGKTWRVVFRDFYTRMKG